MTNTLIKWRQVFFHSWVYLLQFFNKNILAKNLLPHLFEFLSRNRYKILFHTRARINKPCGFWGMVNILYIQAVAIKQQGRSAHGFFICVWGVAKYIENSCISSRFLYYITFKSSSSSRFWYPLNVELYAPGMKDSELFKIKIMMFTGTGC